MNPDPNRTLGQQIRDLQEEQTNLYPLPDIPQLEHRVALLGAQAQININLKGELSAAVDNLFHAHKKHIRNAEINTEIKNLTTLKDQQEAEERQRKIDEATQHMTTMQSEFNTLCKQICRHYEQMHRANLHYERTAPGYRPLRLPEFNFPAMLPPGWQGVTSDMIRSKSLHWLNAEKDKAA